MLGDVAHILAQFGAIQLENLLLVVVDPVALDRLTPESLSALRTRDSLAPGWGWIRVGLLG